MRGVFRPVLLTAYLDPFRALSPGNPYVQSYPATLRCSRVPRSGQSAGDAACTVPPLVHTDLGSLQSGAIRFSLGPFTTEAEIAETIRAMTIIAG
jgi:hypothetical protein